MHAGRLVWWFSAVVLAAVGCGGEDKTTPRIPPSARSWSPPETIEDSKLAIFIQAASDTRGNALLVWDDLDGNVNAKRYDASKRTWTKSEQLDADNPDDSAAPDLAMDGQGNALAVWQRQSQELDTRSVWTNRYDAAKGTWGEATLLENSELVLAPQLAMDRAGNALMAFTRSEIGASVMTARFDVERGAWSAAEPLAPPEGLIAGGPQLALAAGGAGVVVWMDGDTESSAIRAARYEAKSGAWRDVQTIDAKASMAQASGVAINEAGRAVVVWVHTVWEAPADGQDAADGDDAADGEEKISVWTSRSEGPGRPFGEPERLDLEDHGAALLPRVVLDAAGNALVVWSADDKGRRHVWTNRYSAADGAWSGAETLDSGDFDAFLPGLDSDGDGNVRVLWTREVGSRRSPWTRYYSAAEQTWSTPEPLDPDVSGQSEFVKLGLMGDGRALAVWFRDGSTMVASHLR